MSRLRQLGKDSAIYGIGGMLSKSVLFLTLPIYTRIFTPADFGSIEMLTVISSFLSAILVMGMDSAQSMYFFKYKLEGKYLQVRIVSAILQWRLLWGSVVVFLATLISPLLNSVFFKGNLAFEYFAIAFVSSFFAQVMAQSVDVMRLLYRPWSYVSITLLQTLLASALIMLLVHIFDQGVRGYFIGTLIASVSAALLGWSRIIDYLDFSRLHSNFFPELIRFAAPLLPAGIALYFMTTADRLFVQYYHGSEALGLFAIGAKFSLIMAFAVDTFRKAWWPIAMDAMNSDDGPQTFRIMARLYMGIGVASVVILTLLAPWLVKWFTAPVYHESWLIIGILAWQSLFYGFFLIASAGIWKSEKTFLDFYLMCGASVLGLLLNWVLVPSFGGTGAAIATVLTYIVWIVLTMIVSESLWSIAFPWRILCLQTSLGILFSAWYLTSSNTSPFSLALSFGIIVVLLQFLIISMPKLSQHYRSFSR